MVAEVIPKLYKIIESRPPNEELMLAAQTALNAYYSYKKAQFLAKKLESSIQDLVQKARGALGNPASYHAATAISKEAAMQQQQLQTLKNQMIALGAVFDYNLERAKTAQALQLKVEEIAQKKQNAIKKATNAGHATFMNGVKNALAKNKNAKKNLNSSLSKITNQSQQRNYAQLKLITSKMAGVTESLNALKNKNKK